MATTNTQIIEEQPGVFYYWDLTQGSEEWDTLRRGRITASNIDKILTPTLKSANNKDTRVFIYDLATQRITDRTPFQFQSYDMMRGQLEESEARQTYSQKEAPVRECGLILRAIENSDLPGLAVGFSPDGTVGDDGFIEGKSRLAKYQVQTICQHLARPEPESIIPPEYMLQVQAGLYISGRQWCDFLSYSNGMNMIAIRVEPIDEYQEAIESAIIRAETAVRAVVDQYHAAITDDRNRVHPVEWIDYDEEIRAS